MDEHIRLISGSPVTLQYFVPFRFEDSRFDAIGRSFAAAEREGAGLWKEASFPIGNSAVFYDHVLSLMNVRKNPNSVCRSWKMIPPEGGRYLFVRSPEEKIPFTLADVYVHLFRAGIGFFCYQTAFEDGVMRESGQLISFQSRVKRLNRKDRDLLALDESAGQDVWKPVRLGRKIAELIPEEISEEIRFFGGVEKFNLPPVALLYSYLCYDCDNRDALKEVTIHMAMGYDPGNRQSDETIRSCHELANDVFYYVSQNGCAVSVHPNELNMDFFVNYSPASKYSFILFILFYQHCALLNFTMRLYTDFPSDSQSYLGNALFADKMQNFMTDVDTFLMKNDVSTVSNVTQHNLFYETSRKAMRIEEDRQSLRSGFDSLSSIQKSNQERDREEQERKEEDEKEKQSLKIEYLAIFLGLAEILSEVVNFTERVILLCTRPDELKLLDWIAMGLFLIVLILVIAMIVKIKKNKRKKRRYRREKP